MILEWLHLARQAHSAIEGAETFRVPYYDKLYQDAVRDPRLTRTRQELEVAIDNARTARHVVWQLFQDLEGFRLDEYKQIDDRGEGMARLLRYFEATIVQSGGRFNQAPEDRIEVQLDGTPSLQITTNRDTAKIDDQLSLLGLEHPFVRHFLEKDRGLPVSSRAWTVSRSPNSIPRGVLIIWHVQLLHFPRTVSLMRPAA